MKFILEIAVASRNWFNVRKKSNWSDIFLIGRQMNTTSQALMLPNELQGACGGNASHKSTKHSITNFISLPSHSNINSNARAPLMPRRAFVTAVIKRRSSSVMIALHALQLGALNLKSDLRLLRSASRAYNNLWVIMAPLSAPK
jgi:hypothetical protein